MKYKVFSIALAAIFMSGIAAAQTGRDSWNLKGRVKFVEQYTTHYCCTPNDRRKGPRLLSAVAAFDRRGNFTDLVSFHNDGNGPSYERRVFHYDRSGRKSAVEVYRSETNPADTYFTLERREDGRAKLLPERAEKLKERITYGYDPFGRLNEEVSRDANENLIMRRLFQHDAAGNLIRATVLKEGGVVEYESITAIFDGGRRRETTDIRPGEGTNVHMSTLERDGSGRVLRGETFGLKTDDDKRSRYVPVHRTIYTYADERESRMDWIFYKPDGTPESKIVILRNGRGDDFSREEYNAGPLPFGSKNEDIEPEWTFRRRTLKHWEYDKRGNHTKLEWLEQCGPDLPLELKDVHEQVITYH